MFELKIDDFQKDRSGSAGILRISRILELVNSQERGLVKGSNIFLYDPQQNIYVFIGTDSSIFQDEYKLKQFNGLIQIRFRKVQASKAQENKIPRSKNRLISFVRNKVEEWVKIKSAGQVENGTKRKLTYLQAANRIGLSKKTLDDYRQQIKLGIQNGFDFELYKYERMNVLRNFNKNFMKDSVTSAGLASSISTNNCSQEFEKPTEFSNIQALEVSPLHKSLSSEDDSPTQVMELSSESSQMFQEWEVEFF